MLKLVGLEASLLGSRQSLALSWRSSHLWREIDWGFLFWKRFGISFFSRCSPDVPDNQ